MTYFNRSVEVKNVELDIFQQYVGDVGGVVWDAALVMCAFLERLDSKRPGHLEGARVIELGAGTGLVGLAAAVLGAHAFVSDVAEFMPLMTKNIAENCKVLKGGRVEALEIDWRQFCQEEDAENALEVDPILRARLVEKFDYILISDCIYYERLLSFNPHITKVN